MPATEPDPAAKSASPTIGSRPHPHGLLDADEQGAAADARQTKHQSNIAIPSVIMGKASIKQDAVDKMIQAAPPIGSRPLPHGLLDADEQGAASRSDPEATQEMPLRSREAASAASSPLTHSVAPSFEQRPATSHRQEGGHTKQAQGTELRARQQLGEKIQVAGLASQTPRATAKPAAPGGSA
jgi:hypothetical protein